LLLLGVLEGERPREPDVDPSHPCPTR